jgi:taurine dioxygenase
VNIKIKPLPNGIGVECIGLDLSQPINEAIKQTLYSSWIDNGIMVFKNAAHTIEEQLNLSRCFGTLEVHPVKSLVSESKYPELMVLESTAQSKLSVYYREAEPQKPFVGFIPWHSDLVFTTQPNHGAILRSVKNPAQGGHTAWIDTIAAYEALPASTKIAIADLEVEYNFCTSLLDAPYGRDPQLRMQHKGERNFPAFSAVAHPLVRQHPVSGRPVLNLSPLHLTRIVGMEDRQSDELLQELVAHVTGQRFSYVHEWQLDDMVLWDNWRTLHSALGYPLGERRLVHRTTISGGGVAMGRTLEQTAVA